MLLKNRYKVQEKIGAGAFGWVHKALDSYTGDQVVAIKFLTQPDSIDLLQKEVRLLYQQINNRYVVKLLDYDLESRSPYIVLEYCHGGSLRSWVGIDNPWQQIANAIICATVGLAEIHRNNGFHRDIKPDNLLLTTDPDTNFLVVKLGDLGLARIPDAGTMTYRPAGTRNYMAPEVLDAFLKPNHTSYQYAPSADVYSLGITALELLTGKTELQGLKDINKDKVPSGFINLIRRMCALKAEDRPTTVVIAKELGSLLAPPPARIPANSPIPAIQDHLIVNPQPVVHASPPKPQVESPGAVLAGLGLGALALLGLVALLGDKKKYDPEVDRYRGSDGRFRRG